MPWKSANFRDQTVYVRVLADGKPIVRRGLVEIRYKLGATKSYKTARENLDSIAEEIMSDGEFGGGEPGTAAPNANIEDLAVTPEKPATPDTIVIYTDGTSTGNPGPAGVGIHIARRSETLEISEYLASATANGAELSAIQMALEELSEEERASAHVHLYTDSTWALGVLVGGWKAKSNKPQLEKIRQLLEACPDAELLRSKAVGGKQAPGDEEADYLANRAARREASSRKTRPRRGV